MSAITSNFLVAARLRSLAAALLALATAALPGMPRAETSSTDATTENEVHADSAPAVDPDGPALSTSLASQALEPPDDAAERRLSRPERRSRGRLRAARALEPTGKTRFDRLDVYVDRFIDRQVSDPKSSVFEVRSSRVGETGALLEGNVLFPEYKDGLTTALLALGYKPVQNNIRALLTPETEPGRWGICTTHTLSLRRSPRPRSEQLDQAAFSAPLRLLDADPTGEWQRVIIPDGYVGWAQTRHIQKVSKADFHRIIDAPRRARTRVPLVPGNGAEFSALAFEIPRGTRIALTEAGDALVSNSLRLYPALAAARERSLAAVTGAGAAWVPVLVPRAVAPAAPGTDPLVVAFVQRALLAIDTAFPESAALTELHNIYEPLLERPYVWGGISDRGVDCSGFTQFVYRMKGYSLARDADQQAIGGEVIALRGEGFEAVRPGDLHFFLSENGGRISHVAVSLGGTEFVHAAGEKVQFGSLDRKSPRYSERYADKYGFTRRYGIGFGVTAMVGSQLGAGSQAPGAAPAPGRPRTR